MRRNEDGDFSKQYNSDTARNVMKSEGMFSFEGDFLIVHIGSRVKRRIDLQFDELMVNFGILAKSKNVKINDNYGTVFIAPDRSRKKRAERRS